MFSSKKVQIFFSLIRFLIAVRVVTITNKLLFTQGIIVRIYLTCSPYDQKGQDVALNKLLNIRKFNSASKVNPMNYLEKTGQKRTLVTENLHKRVKQGHVVNDKQCQK